MRRRQFLSALPALALPSASAQTPSGQRGSISIRIAGNVHPQVEAVLRDLGSQLQALGYDVRGDSGEGHILSVELSSGELASEEYELVAEDGNIRIRGGDNRALLYGVADLRRILAQEKVLPASLHRRRRPTFAVRRWSTAISHMFGAPWDERIHLVDRLRYIHSEVLPRAIDFGMNAIELNGRPDDGWDVDWVISFQKYSKLAATYPAEERRSRLSLIEDLAQAAHDHLLDVFVWTHELHLPPGFVELYPQARGTSYPVCLSNPFLKQFIRDKYIEFFEAVPSVDGLVVSVNESGQFSLLTDQGCRCDQCIRMSQHDRLRAVLDEVVAVCGQLRKQVVLRTFQSASIHTIDGHPELETIRKAYTDLPPHIQIMSKYCPLDFYGGAIADEPLIGAFPNQHLVEFSLDVEWQGRTYIPVLTPENFRRRIAHAVEKRCAGVVARIDFPFPTMEPGILFGHPNEFNAWFMGDVLWDTDTVIDSSLARWAAGRYGTTASTKLAPALRKTEEITQKTFFCLGQTVINYHNMLGDISHADNFLWEHALSKWDPSKRALSESFFAPDDDLIARAMTEKAEALALANVALEEAMAARGDLNLEDYEKHRYWFEKLRDNAVLWRELLEAYLRHRQVSSSPVKPEVLQSALDDKSGTRIATISGPAGRALQQAYAMEVRHGANCWPVISPDRGISVYQFIQEILRHYIAGVTGEDAKEKPRYTYRVAIFDPDSTESLWRSLVELGRPGNFTGSAQEFSLRALPEVESLTIERSQLRVMANSGRALSLPLPFAVVPVVLHPRKPLSMRMHKGVEAIRLEIV